MEQTTEKTPNLGKVTIVTSEAKLQCLRLLRS